MGTRELVVMRCGLVRTWVLKAIRLLAIVLMFSSSPASAQLVLVDFGLGTDAPLSLYVDQGPVSRTFQLSTPDPFFSLGHYRLTSSAMGTIATSLDTTSSYADFSSWLSTTGFDLGTEQEVGIVAYASTAEFDGYKLTFDFGDETLRLARLDDGIEVVLAQAVVSPPGDSPILLFSRTGADLVGSIRANFTAPASVVLSVNDDTYGLAEVGLFAASDPTAFLDVTVRRFSLTSDLEDADNDLVPDANDNCVNDSNGPFDPHYQTDHDSDGYGTSCDCDFTQDGVVLGNDVLSMFGAFGGAGGVYDVTGDGNLLGDDILFCFGQFNGPPG